MKIETVLSPALFPFLPGGVEGKQVVVIDILRATTTMCVALDRGCDEMVAVAKVEEALAYRQKGYLLAGEREGYKVEGFDFGNSPQEYDVVKVKGKKIVITTTNGTQALSMSRGADKVWVSSFYNLAATVAAIKAVGLPVVMFCSGWKNRFNMEDTLFAGAMVDLLEREGFEIEDDASRASLYLWREAKVDLAGFLENANHVQRFKSMHAESDLEACLRLDIGSRAILAEYGDEQDGERGCVLKVWEA